MLSEESFNLLVDEIMAQGYTEETAAEYAALIGDAPVRDEYGRVLVMKDGVVLAALVLRFFD